jgi:hypothetical protein
VTPLTCIDLTSSVMRGFRLDRPARGWWHRKCDCGSVFLERIDNPISLQLSADRAGDNADSCPLPIDRHGQARMSSSLWLARIDALVILIGDLQAAPIEKTSLPMTAWQLDSAPRTLEAEAMWSNN